MLQAVRRPKLVLSEVNHKRRVRETLYRLNEDKKSELMKSPIEVVFSVAFLERALKGNTRQRNMTKPSRSIIAGLQNLGAKTLEDAVKLEYLQLDVQDNFGSSSMALYLDLLTAFDLPIPTLPSNGPVSVEHHSAAHALAKKLGLK